MEIEKTTPERRLLARAAQKRRPASGTLELSPLCNLNCDMCYVRLTPAELAAKGRLRTAEEWLSLAEQMERAGVLFLLLLTAGLLAYDTASVDQGGVGLLSACLCGGGIAGVLGGASKKKRRR